MIASVPKGLEHKTQKEFELRRESHKATKGRDPWQPEDLELPSERRNLAAFLKTRLTSPVTLPGRKEVGLILNVQPAGIPRKMPRRYR